MKLSLLVSLPTACLMTFPAWSQDLTFSHPSGATATFYGQFNFTYQHTDDGFDSYDEFVDNNNSGSRVGFWIDVPMAEDQLRFNLEVNLGLRNTAETSQTDDVDWIDWERTDIRKIEGVYIGSFGSLWFGQGSMATDGVAEFDNSGTTLAGYASLPDMAGSYEFRDGDALSGVSVSDVFGDLDGGRRFRLRYDTPDLYGTGIKLSAAYGEEILSKTDDATYYDVAVRYGLENDQMALDAGIGYAWKDGDGDTIEQIIASGSFKHIPTGLNLTLATGDKQDDSGNYIYTKIGWEGQLIQSGSTALSVDYYDGSDFSVSGSTSESWGLQAVQKFDDIKLEAYLGYREFSYDDNSAASYQDLKTLLAGARWRF